MDRRALLAGALALTSVPALSNILKQAPGFYRTRVGDISVTTLYDGELRRPIDESYVRNAAIEDVRHALSHALLPATHIDNPYTFTAARTDGQLILIDTGTGDLLDPSIDEGERSLSGAGIDRAEVDMVILTHYHPDHVGGLTLPGGAPAFPNAEILFPRGEHAFIHDPAAVQNLPQIMQDFAEAARRRLAAYGDRVRLYEDGDVLAEGVTALSTPGHTPDHMAIRLESRGETLIVVGDAVTYPALFIANPDWHVVFDGDGIRAQETRTGLLSRAAETGSRFVGTHFPFPSIGRIVTRGRGFAYVPDRWTILD